MHPQQLKKKASRPISSSVTNRLPRDPTSYLKTRIRGSRLRNAARILVLIELTQRLHQAYRQAYDKQAADRLLPQNPAARPAARRVASTNAKFDIERLKDCLKAKFNTTLGPSDGRSQGYDVTNGIFTGFYGSIQDPFQIRIDQTSRTLADIRTRTGNPRAMAMADPNDSYLVYLGSDAFASSAAVYRIAAQIHEIGNNIYQEYGKFGLTQPQASSRLQRLVNDSDAGLALEECVFGGYVMKNGRVLK